MNILIIAHFVHFSHEKGNSRFTYLAEKLADAGNDVELITSTFLHLEKRQRVLNDFRAGVEPYKVKLIYEPGYKKNISIDRLHSHKILGKNLAAYLEERKKPDVIYCAVPSLDAASNAAKYTRTYGIRLIIDIQDLWPEAFKMAFNIPIISDILFHPMKKMADYIYRSADYIVGVSKTYVDRALSVCNRNQKGVAVFLGTDLKSFDDFVAGAETIKPEGELWIAYIGTLGHSYDIKLVIDAIKLANSNGERNIKFIVIGDGPLKKEYEEYAIHKNISCEFTGFLDYHQMVERLCACDIAVNPITSGSAASIINKVGDYAAAGLPVINTQECEEYRELIEEYNCGSNCEPNNSNQFAEAILELYNNPELLEQQGKNSRKLAEEKFDRRITYNKIVNLLIIQ